MRRRAAINVVDEHPNSHRENEPDYIQAPDAPSPAIELVDDLAAIDSWAPERRREGAMFDVPPMMWAQLSELVTTALRWFKSGGDGTAEPPRGLRNGYVRTAIPVDITGWRYASNIDESKLPESINVVIHTEASEPPPGTAFGNWVDSSDTLKLWLAGDAIETLRESDMLANARHELTHAAQTLLQRGKGLKKLPGLGPQTDRNEEPNPSGLSHFKRNIDMYPYLANELAEFEQATMDMSAQGRADAAKAWVVERPRFMSLREHDENRWRKMVTEFTRAVTATRQADLMPGGAADDVPDDRFDADQLARGIAEELEHTNDENIAREVAKDHLIDDPEYYREAQLKWVMPALLGFGVGTMMDDPPDDAKPAALESRREYSQSEVKRAIQNAAAQHGVDPALLDALVQAESNYKPHARSGAGALGLTQLMPGTAESLGVEDPFDVEQNLSGGARYLKQQLDAFGDVELALAAYNAGPGAVRKHKGVPPFAETRAYVKRIMSKYRPSKDGSAEHTAESGFNLTDLTERQTNVPHRMNTHRDMADSYHSWNQSEDPMDKMGRSPGTVVIMRGLPGSGKSTAVKKLQKEYGVEPFVCSADKHFERDDGTYAFDPAALPTAHKACRAAFDQAIADGEPLVVVDNTNTQAWEFEPYVRAARAAGYDVRVESTHGDPKALSSETLDEWSRRNVHSVPRSAYDRMVKRWEDYDPKNARTAGLRCAAYYEVGSELSLPEVVKRWAGSSDKPFGWGSLVIDVPLDVALTMKRLRRGPGIGYRDESEWAALKAEMQNGWRRDQPLSVIVHKDGARAADGNHRLEIAKQLGLKTVPVRISDFYISSVGDYYNE